MSTDVEISKFLSHALRHEPWLYELELDDEGWAPLDAVVKAMREERQEWSDSSHVDIRRAVESSSRRRHEISGERIRALYGHSIPGTLRRQPAVPPDLLFHGTSPDVITTIMRDGLKPMSRQYVHLSIDTATAHEVGRRKSGMPVLLEVIAKAAHDSGVLFYAGNGKVWLTAVIPAIFIKTIPWRTT